MPSAKYQIGATATPSHEAAANDRDQGAHAGHLGREVDRHEPASRAITVATTIVLGLGVDDDHGDGQDPDNRTSGDQGAGPGSAELFSRIGGRAADQQHGAHRDQDHGRQVIRPPSSGEVDIASWIWTPNRLSSSSFQIQGPVGRDRRTPTAGRR